MACWFVFICFLASIQLGLGQNAPSRKHGQLLSTVSRTILTNIVAAETFSDLEFFEQVSAASYCSENNIGPNIRLKCRTGNCPHVNDADIRTVIGLS